MTAVNQQVGTVERASPFAIPQSLPDVTASDSDVSVSDPDVFASEPDTSAASFLQKPVGLIGCLAGWQLLQRHYCTSTC